MRNGRMLSRWRAAALAVVAVLGLAACGEDATGSSALLGTWEATLEGSNGLRLEDRLVITPTGYEWTQEVYGPGGRPEDGLQDRFVHRGDWKIADDRLAVRATSMQHWTYPHGEWIVDFVIQWNTSNRIASLQGDRMTISYEPPPEQSYVRPTLHFQRVSE